LGGKATRAANKRQKRAGRGEAPKKDTVRVMLPFNVQCEKCGAYMHRGRKFNARKEDNVDAAYMATKVVRFTFKCERCSSAIVFRTNPRTAGFDVVSGARENAATRGAFNALDGVPREDPQEGDGAPKDAMAALEARAVESKREMAVLDELDREFQLREARARVAAGAAPRGSAAADVEEASDEGAEEEGAGEAEADEADSDAEARRAFGERRRRDMAREEEELARSAAASVRSGSLWGAGSGDPSELGAAALPEFRVVRRGPASGGSGAGQAAAAPAAPPPPPPPASAPLASLVAGYGSGSGDDDDDDDERADEGCR